MTSGFGDGVRYGEKSAEIPLEEFLVVIFLSDTGRIDPLSNFVTPSIDPRIGRRRR